MAVLIDDAATIWELMARRALLTPDDPAMLDGNDRRVTFGGLKAWSERVAAGLVGLGVGEATPVSVQLPTRMETMVLSLALARLGAVQNPILHLYRERELGAVLRRMSPAVYCCPGVWGGVDYPAMVSAVADQLPSPPIVITAYDTLPEGDAATLPPPPGSASAEEVRWIYFTSGTTSEPKGVRHTDATLLAGGVAVAKSSGWSPSDVVVIAYPITHIGGAGSLVYMLAVGLPLVLLESFVRVPDQDPLRFDEMVAHLRTAGLMVQKIPEQLEVVDELPRSQALRKVLKYQLREHYARPGATPP